MDDRITVSKELASDVVHAARRAGMPLPHASGPETFLLALGYLVGLAGQYASQMTATAELGDKLSNLMDKMMGDDL